VWLSPPTHVFYTLHQCQQFPCPRYLLCWPSFLVSVTRFSSTRLGVVSFTSARCLRLFRCSLVYAFLFYDDIPEDFLACDPGVRVIDASWFYVLLYEEAHSWRADQLISLSSFPSQLRMFVWRSTTLSGVSPLSQTSPVPFNWAKSFASNLKRTVALIICIRIKWKGAELAAARQWVERTRGGVVVSYGDTNG
jgi:hypothetical protein